MATMMETGRDEPQPRSRNLLAACVAHALHDGYTDGLYVLMPVWQAEFGLSYAGLAIVRALYSGTMGGLQLPADALLRGVTARTALILSTLITAAGFLILALPTGLAGLCIGVIVAGMGSSIQHPRGSLLVTESYGTASRGPLGIYNFSGDIGKATLPTMIALLLPLMAWRPVMGLMAILGLVVALGLFSLVPAGSVAPRKRAEARHAGGGRGGFGVLTAIGALDTATRYGYLLFLPFLVQDRGGTSATIGIALALLFIGGAFGKATSNRLGDRLGVAGCVIATETATALLIVATLFVPLLPLLILLPLLGIVLNGTSSVLYGTVPELAPNGDSGRAFAIFYTSVIGAGGLAPILFGIVADHSNRSVGIVAAAGTAALILPLVLALRPHLGQSPPTLSLNCNL